MSIPLFVHFTVLNVSASDEVYVKDREVSSTHRLSLVLQADPETSIALSTGEALSAVETHVTLMRDVKSSVALASELSGEEVGYLIHSDQGVHGAVLWPREPLPYYLLVPGLKAEVVMTFSSLATTDKQLAPHSWEQGRQHLIRVASFTINCGRD